MNKYLIFQGLFASLVQYTHQTSEDIRKNNPDLVKKDSYATFLRDFCTLTIDVPQRSGKSSAVTNLATNEDMIVTWDLSNRDTFCGEPCSAEIVSYENLFNGFWITKRESINKPKPRVIYFEDASWHLQGKQLQHYKGIMQQKSAYEILGDKNNNQTFVLVG